MSEVAITRHAVSRFIKRHAPGMSTAEAKAHLQREIQKAARLKARTIKGSEQWQIEDPPCILVMKTDNRNRRLKVCLTVLPEPDLPAEMTLEEMLQFRELEQL